MGYLYFLILKMVPDIDLEEYVEEIHSVYAI
jgi:hypothetical protein